MGKFDNLKDLPPEERIERLKKIADEDKKEIEEAQRLLADSEQEVEEEERQRINIPIPQMRAIDVGSLFSEAEKEMFREKRPLEASLFRSRNEEGTKTTQPDAQRLEQAVEDEGSLFGKQLADTQQQYVHHLATEVPASDLYHGISELASIAHDRGYLDSNQQRRLGELYMATKEKQDDFQQGAYHAAMDTGQQIQESLDLFHSLKKHYLQ